MARKKRNYSNWGPTAPAKEKQEGSLADRPEVNLAAGDHFATRARANEFVRLMRTLPDPDPVLRKMGRGISALQELLTDSHLESVWSVRCAAVSGAEWYMEAGAEGVKQQEAADEFARQLEALDVPRIIEEMMDAVAYGYSPLEVLWSPDGDRWGIGNIVGKPPQWFEFDQYNRLVFRTGFTATEEVPENRFLLVRHRPSYANPYGDKVFSKCFWPVTFKKNGFRWWTVFVEKYGGAFLYGKYPNNAGNEYKAELLSALESMVADAVAIAPEGSEITIEGAEGKAASSSVYAEYITMANSEISKAVLGQTLTTEIGKNGSYAAAMTHNQVRDDLAAADRRRVASAFNRLAAVFTLYNYGSGVEPPVFVFAEDEDLQDDRAERDTKLFALGFRPKKSYIAREYGISEDDFDLVNPGEPGAAFSRASSALIPESEHPEDCGCGCQDGAENPAHIQKTEPSGKKSGGLFGFLPRLFADKEDRAREKDDRLTGDFETPFLKKGQEETDATIDRLLDAAAKAETFEAAFEILASAYEGLSVSELAQIIDNLRYAGSQIGASRG
jgi:hypothetical protein